MNVFARGYISFINEGVKLILIFYTACFTLHFILNDVLLVMKYLSIYYIIYIK